MPISATISIAYPKEASIFPASSSLNSASWSSSSPMRSVGDGASVTFNSIEAKVIALSRSSNSTFLMMTAYVPGSKSSGTSRYTDADSSRPAVMRSVESTVPFLISSTSME
ncbi:hypothetical protein DSECCO2_557010 [anaerobic digester metagenome]